jgi:hypothetical protein
MPGNNSKPMLLEMRDPFGILISSARQCFSAPQEMASDDKN